MMTDPTIDPQAVTNAAGLTKTVQQCLATVQHGFRLQSYVYQYVNYPEWAPAQLGLLDRATYLGAQPEFLWLDVEDVSAGLVPAQIAAAISRDLAVLDSWCSAHGLPPVGIYTGSWYWPRTGYSTAFADRKLWYASYDKIAQALVDFAPFGGWDESDVAIKQYDSVPIDGIGGVDEDVTV